LALNTLIEIEAALGEVTEAEVGRAEMHLDAIGKGETSLGTIHDPDAHRMWATAEKFQRIEAEGLIKLKFEVDTLDDQTRLASESARAHSMESLCRDIFWIMARDAIGQDAWNSSSIGVRSGWVLVTTTAPPNPGAVLKALFGTIPPGGL